MNTFRAHDLAWLIYELQDAASRYRWMAEDSSSEEDTVSPGMKQQVDELFEKASELCHECDFSNAKRVTARALISASDYGITYAAMKMEIEHVTHAIIDEMEARQFLFVKPRFKNCVDNDSLLGEEVREAFPLAAEDIKQAGNCLAAECGTAAVFHLMRATEWGLRALCRHLGLLKAKRARKSGKVEYVPIPYTDWETMLNQLHRKVEQRIERIKRGPLKQKEQEFYFPILQDIKAIRDAWRNHVMHTRSQYEVDDAVAILVHVRRIMTALSAKVGE